MNEFQDETPTKPDPPESLVEVLERWRSEPNAARPFVKQNPVQVSEDP